MKRRYAVSFTLNVFNLTVQIMRVEEWRGIEGRELRVMWFDAEDELGAYQAFIKWLGERPQYTLKEHD